MDWKIVMAVFSAVFFAELADKTQIVGIAMTAKSGKPVSVWVGSVLAYMVVTVLSVLMGSILTKYVRPEIIKYTGACLFILMGILMLSGKI